MRIYTAALASGDGGALRIALVAAVLLHVAALFVIRVPETAPPPARAAEDRTAITIRKYLPPAPPAARRRVPRRRVERKLPVPDLTPLELEPLVEPQPVFELEPLPAEIELLIPRPEPPPLDGSLRAGVGGVTEPVRIEDSYVRPDYPAAHSMRAAVLGHLDRLDEARAALEDCERLQPGFVASRADWSPYRDPALNAHLHAGVRKTGHGEG